MNRVLFIFAVLISSAAAAAEYSDLYIVPVAGHTGGALGTSWRSDVVLHNLQSVPITVEIVLVESGRSPSTEPLAIDAGLQLMPGETRILADVAGSQGRDITGALIIGASLPFAVTSRIWAEGPAGRTLGQTVPPVAISGTADAVNDVAVLASLMAGGGQRSNAGVFVAASHAPFVVEVAVLSAAGATLASQLIVVEEAGFVHRQLAISPMTGAMTAVVRILEGEGIVVPYASIVDNITAEAVFVSGEAISRQGLNGRLMLLHNFSISAAQDARHDQETHTPSSPHHLTHRPALPRHPGAR